MIDFHSHILPGMDDGSKNTKESLAMLELLREQGVKSVVATPHFYANYESVSEFIERREFSYNRLKESLKQDFPKIILGAEVRYYEGISNLDNISELCIGESSLLLMEMPSIRWTEYTLNELYSISSRCRITPVLAHIERYIDYQSPEVFDNLLASDVLMQVNASFITAFFTSHKALKWLKKGKVHFIGSDCHNLTTRPPEILKAYDVIGKKLGKNFRDSFIDYQIECSY